METNVKEQPVFKPKTLNQVKAAREHANPKWYKAALLAVKKLAKRRETFTTADVLAELKKTDVKTHDLRAIGPVMVDAKKSGWIESDGLVRRNDSHTRGATTLWRSKIRPAPKAIAPSQQVEQEEALINN